MICFFAINNKCREPFLKISTKLQEALLNFLTNKFRAGSCNYYRNKSPKVNFGKQPCWNTVASIPLILKFSVFFIKPLELNVIFYGVQLCNKSFKLINLNRALLYCHFVAEMNKDSFCFFMPLSTKFSGQWMTK